MSQDFVSSLLDFPPENTKILPSTYDKRANTYVKGLREQNDSAWLKANKGNVLAVLDPSQNSLPYLFALYTQAVNVGKDASRAREVLDHVAVFFATFDPIQVRYAGDVFRLLWEWAVEVHGKLSITDCSALTTALLRLDPPGATFTSSHLRLLRLCLTLGVPSQALPILDRNITAFPQTPPKNVPNDPLCDDHAHSNAFLNPNTGLTNFPLKSENILEYYLLGAHVYLAQRNFPRARLFLEFLLLHPTGGAAASSLQAEAYKKWLILGLLAQGKSYPLPRTHNQQVFKSLKATSRAYEAIVDAFEKRAWRKFHAEAEVGHGVWQEDGNEGLVREASQALLRYRVLDLQTTYAALPVSRVARHLECTPQIALDQLTAMIQQGHLNAHVISTPSDTVLHFNPDVPLATTSTVIASGANVPTTDDSLEARTARIQTLISAIRDADRRLQLTKEYVEVQKRGKRGAAGPDGDLADQMDLTYDGPIPGFGDDDDGVDPRGLIIGEEDIMEN